VRYDPHAETKIRAEQGSIGDLAHADQHDAIARDDRPVCGCRMSGTPALRSIVKQKPIPERRNAAQATLPIPSIAIPLVGAGPGLPSGLMNRVLPVGNNNNSARGRTISWNQEQLVRATQMKMPPSG
jgi:hypothetical protein